MSQMGIEFLVMICYKLQGDLGDAPGAIGAVETALWLSSGGQAVII
jgi:hypothetical protein